MRAMSFLSKRPWILIVLLLGGFISAWIVLLVVAHRNPPVLVPLEK
jgi:F0F1-type ATP synthase assembly protein I